MIYINLLWPFLFKKAMETILETKRLRIQPLTLEQFRLLIEGVEKMENDLMLTPSHVPLDEHTQKAMEWLYNEAQKTPEEYLWLTNWQIILKSENKSIGSADFKNLPGENGEVEIGYGINSEYEGRGYMTETVEAMCKWALIQDGVKCVIAETEKDNYASQRVLQKCGMEKYKETDTGFWWKLSSDNSFIYEGL